MTHSVDVMHDFRDPTSGTSFGRTMALGSTQPLTEMSTRTFSGEKRRPVCRVDKLTTFMCRLSGNLRAPNSWSPQDPTRAVQW